MSIFPKTCVPGGAITFHVRDPGPRSASLLGVDKRFFGEICLSVFDPSGERITVKNFMPALRPALQHESPQAGAQDQIRTKFPLLFVSEMLETRKHKSSELLFFLENIRNSTHFYHHYHVPSNALPGNYRTLLEMWFRGVRVEKWNDFQVEWIEVIDAEVSGSGMVVSLENKSRDSVAARVTGFNKDSPSRIVSLEAESETVVQTDEMPALLLYADEAQSIPLGPREDVIVISNPRFPWVDRAASHSVVVLGENTSDDGFELMGDAREIWLAAQAPALRSQMRIINGDLYDAMVEAHMVIEIPCNLNWNNS